MNELTQVRRRSTQLGAAYESRDIAIHQAHERGATFREIAEAAGLTAGRVHQIVNGTRPWTKADEKRAKALRETSQLTEAERDELTVLRHREITEAARLRRKR